MIFAVAREAGGLCRLRIEFSAAEVAGVFAEDAGCLEPSDARLAAERVQEKLVRGGMAKALADAGLEPVCRPSPLGVPPLPRQGAPFAFEADASVVPDIPLPAELASLGMPQVDAEPAPLDLQEAYDQLTRRAVSLGEVAEFRAPRPGDVADVDVDAEAEGSPLPELHRRKARRWLGQILPEGLWGPVEKALFGLRQGESCELAFPCPEDHADPLLRGRPVHAKVVLARLWERLPKDENTLARSLGFKDAKALRGTAAMRARGKAAARAFLKAQEILVDSLLEGLDFHMPEGLVAWFLGQAVQRTELWYANFQASPGIASRRDKAMALAQRLARPAAVQEARRHLLLLALAGRLGLAVSQAELEEAVRGSLHLGQDAAQAMAWLEEQGELSLRRNALLAGKALEALCAGIRS